MEYPSGPRYPFFVQDALDEQPPASAQKGVDVVVVADAHDGVSLVGQAYATGHFRQVNRITVTVGELEAGAKHQLPVRSLHKAHVRTELLAEPPLERFRI